MQHKSLGTDQRCSAANEASEIDRFIMGLHRNAEELQAMVSAILADSQVSGVVIQCPAKWVLESWAEIGKKTK